jgi:hypothetical protein
LFGTGPVGSLAPGLPQQPVTVAADASYSAGALLLQQSQLQQQQLVPDAFNATIALPAGLRAQLQSVVAAREASLRAAAEAHAAALRAAAESMVATAQAAAEASEARATAARSEASALQAHIGSLSSDLAAARAQIVSLQVRMGRCPGLHYHCIPASHPLPAYVLPSSLLGCAG